MGLISSLNEAVLAKARSSDKLADKVFASETNEGDPAPLLPLPYVMIFFDNGQRTSDLMAYASEKANFNFTVHYVAETFEQLNWLADAMMDQWLNWRPIVPGYRCFKMTHNFSTPDNTNDAVKPPLLYRVDEWGVRAIKGKAV